MKKLILFLFLFTAANFCQANPEIVIYQSPLVWRADGQGNFLFQGNGQLKGCAIGADGSVVYASAPGTFELSAPITAEGMILSVAANWTFTGAVKLEVSPTGNSADYQPVTNGVPLDFTRNSGSSLKWRATLAAQSSLSEVRIAYKDISGVSGTFGNPDLSGFNFRKIIYLKGDSTTELFNYPLQLTIGESAATEKTDLNLKGIIQSDFSDVRFTQADGETLLPCWREALSGSVSSARTAVFWVRAPQIPKEGLMLYLYYGKSGATDLSNGSAVFDFYDDFKSANFNDAKWQAYDFSQAQSVEYKLKSDPALKILAVGAMGREEIISFFKANNNFEWARVRQTSAAAAVDADKTKLAAEEVPSLPGFSGTAIAANGDLILDGQNTTGSYLSVFLYPSFDVRIMVADWDAVVAAQNKATIDISAQAQQALFKTDCEKGKYYYASRQDFSAGKTLALKARLSRDNAAAQSSRLKRLSLDYRPGVITLTSPVGGENLKAGDNYEISWSALEYEPSYPIKIEYSADAGSTYNTVTRATDNLGKYLWQVPNINSRQMLVRVSDSLESKIYGVSNSVFSIGAGAGNTAVQAPSAPASQGTTAATQSKLTGTLAGVFEKGMLIFKAAGPEKKKGRQGQEAKLYELLIKQDASSQVQGAYQAGDIVMVKPAGHLWGASERSRFLIVQAYLTEKDVEELMQPHTRQTADASGAATTEMLKRRKHSLDLKKHSQDDKPLEGMSAIQNIEKGQEK